MRARQLIDEATEADLGDGFKLVGYTDTIYKAMLGDQLVGSLYLDLTDRRSSVPAVREIRVYDDARGKGLGRRMLTALLKIHPVIRSDPTGSTSDEAARMWDALGAYHLLTTDRGYGDSWYALPNPPPFPRVVQPS